MCIVFAILTSTLATSVAAQAPSTEAPSRGVAIGLALTPTWAGGVEVWPTARLSVPITTRFAFDLDAGRTLPAASRVFRTDAVYGVNVRFVRPLRGSERTKRYWIVGPTWIAGRDLVGANQRHTISAFRLGYGGDERIGRGVRVAAEFGIIGGGPDAPTGLYTAVAVQWMPRGSRLP